MGRSLAASSWLWSGLSWRGLSWRGCLGSGCLGSGLLWNGLSRSGLLLDRIGGDPLFGDEALGFRWCGGHVLEWMAANRTGGLGVDIGLDLEGAEAVRAGEGRQAGTLLHIALQVAAGGGRVGFIHQARDRLTQYGTGSGLVPSVQNGPPPR